MHPAAARSPILSSSLKFPIRSPSASNTALQTDDRRAMVVAERNMTLAPLAAERQSRYAQSPGMS